MHPLLGLTSVGLVLLAGTVVLAILPRLGGWSRRRNLQFLVLAAPVVSLGLSVGALHHFTGQVCFITTPPWDYRLGIALPLVMGAIAVAGVAIGFGRLMLMHRTIGRQGKRAPAELQVVASRMAAQLGSRTPRLHLFVHDQPLALTYGLLRPTVLLSTWMVERLDAQELEGVLAHEIAHVCRRDYLVVWLATVLRDAFFYLPTSAVAHRQLQQEKEIACDDLAAHATGRPLALASALTKVWQPGIQAPSARPAQALTDTDERIEQRIERLLAAPKRVHERPPRRMLALGVGGATLGALLALEAANAAVMLAPDGLWRGVAAGQAAVTVREHPEADHE